MRHFGLIVGSVASAVNIYAYFAMGHDPLNLIVAVFCALCALASWAFTARSLA